MWRDSAEYTSKGKVARRVVNDGQQNPPAIATAKGHGPSIDNGNPRFPFRFARYYSMSRGGKIHQEALY